MDQTREFPVIKKSIAIGFLKYIQIIGGHNFVNMPYVREISKIHLES